MPMRTRLTILIVFCTSGHAAAAVMPDANDLPTELLQQVQTVTVVEPHLSDRDQQTRRDYRAIPAQAILAWSFGPDWQEQADEVVFLALDGYRSAIPVEKLLRYQAWLAFALADGTPFEVDNLREHESIISLGPWYLIWENIGKPELLEVGTYGWPYQVNQLQLQTNSEFEQLAPTVDDAELASGYSAFRTYCLSCHMLNGVGGLKYGLDLELAQCGRDDTTLVRWILRPEASRPGTIMPALNPMLAETLRERTAMQIVAYLRTRQKCP